MLPHTFIFEPSQTESSYSSIKEKGHLNEQIFHIRSDHINFHDWL